MTMFAATKCRFTDALYTGRAGDISRYTLYMSGVRLCVEERVSRRRYSTHSVSRLVPPGTAKLTENFAARGEPRALLSAAEHSRVPHFPRAEASSRTRGAKRHSRVARSPSPGINPRLDSLWSKNAYSDTSEYPKY